MNDLKLLSAAAILLTPATLAAQATGSTGSPRELGSAARSSGGSVRGTANSDGLIIGSSITPQGTVGSETGQPELILPTDSRVPNPPESEGNVGTPRGSTSEYPNGSSPMTGATTATGTIAPYPGAVTAEPSSDAAGSPAQPGNGSTPPASTSTTPGATPD